VSGGCDFLATYESESSFDQLKRPEHRHRLQSMGLGRLHR
jgi:hypothetical protein